MPAASLDPESLARRARFVFRGTVEKAKAANVAAVDDKSRTAIVRVDEILQGPDVFRPFTGREITVKLSRGEAVRKGDRAVFYTNGWLFGETIAVESIGHLPAAGQVVATAAAAEPAVSLEDRDVQERLATADAVVVGTVSSVRIPSEQGVRRAAVAGGAAPRGRISEHDPQWREAIVRVARVEKGAQKPKEVVIRFPGSDDVRWYKAPKFTPGQQGVFILHKTAKSARGVRAAATLTMAEAGAAKEAFTALHPCDFQPSERQPQVKALMATAPARGNRAPKPRKAVTARRGARTRTKRS